MPWPTYSERFLHHQGAGRWDYTVPAGTRAILTALDVINYAVPGAIIAVTIGPIFIEYLSFQAAEPVIHRSMRAVAYQGEVIALQLSMDGIHSTLSGYLMSDTSGATGPPLDAQTKPVPPDVPILKPLPGAAAA